MPSLSFKVIPVIMKTRFAPSPTGYLHIGGARTALFSWLLARHHLGQFVLRIEDTDQQRSSKESIHAILQSMQWLGLDYDEGPYYQTQRITRYQAIIQQLLDEDKAYYCYCDQATLDKMRKHAMAKGEKPKYNGHCRHRKDTPAGIEPVIRFKTPQQGSVQFIDQVKGTITIHNSELDDLIIARSNGMPTYNLTVVVDDWDMAITHVVRGDDHLNNTPRQIHILQALGAKLPTYAHLPMILGSDGKRLSKRHHALNVMQYADDGYLPQALLNYLLRLGFADGDKELFTRQQMITTFSLQGVNKTAAVFNLKKLNWLNQQYIKTTNGQMLADDLNQRLGKRNISTHTGPQLVEMVDALRTRVTTLDDMAQKAQVFYSDFAHFDQQATQKNLQPSIYPPMARLREQLALLTDWQPQAIHQLLKSITIEFAITMAQLGPSVRVAITGNTASPPLDMTLYLMGKTRTIQRLDKALQMIAKHRFTLDKSPVKS